MKHPKEPTNEQMVNKEPFVLDGETGFYTWYPQMGGYVGKCAVMVSKEGCFDVWVWHDGEFPFGEDSYDPSESPKFLHHCNEDQFIRFANDVTKFRESLTQ